MQLLFYEISALLAWNLFQLQLYKDAWKDKKRAGAPAMY